MAYLNRILKNPQESMESSGIFKNPKESPGIPGESWKSYGILFPTLFVEIFARTNFRAFLRKTWICAKLREN